MLRALLILVALLAGSVAGVEAREAREACSPSAGGPCPSYDIDGDGIRNEPPYPPGPDNCIDIKNADQDDSDQDGTGDACETDDDNDGVPDAQDNCRTVHNPEQNDVCATDYDGDGIRDQNDNCPRSGPNPDQTDLDQDRRGDICDADDDSDGVADYMDNCPRDENASQEDGDGDGKGKVCDPDEIRPPAEPTPAPGEPGSGSGTPAAPNTPGATSSDDTAPRLTLSGPRTWGRDDLRGGAPLLVRCTEACGLTVRLTLRGKLVGKGTAALGGAGRTFVFLAPARGALASVGRLRGRARAALSVRAVDEAGNRRSATRRVWLRR